MSTLHQFSFVADHFQYLASIGVLVLVVSGLFWLASEDRRGLVVGLFALALPVLAIVSFRQTRVYADEQTLWLATVRVNAGSWMSWNNLGHLALDRGEPANAEAYLRRCIEIKPDHFNAQSNIAEALRRLGRHEEALPAIDRAIELGHAMVADGRFDSGAAFAKEHHQRGMILAALIRPEDAERAYNLSLESRPDQPPVRLSLAMLLLGQERVEEAAPHLLAYLEWDPNNLAALDALGQIAEDAGRHGDADHYYWRAVQAADRHDRPGPDGVELHPVISSCPDLQVRNVEKGIGIAENMNQAARGQFPEVLDVLAAAYAEAGRFAEAVSRAEQAVQLARAAGRYDLATEIESRRERYRNRETFWSQ